MVIVKRFTRVLKGRFLPKVQHNVSNNDNVIQWELLQVLYQGRNSRKSYLTIKCQSQPPQNEFIYPVMLNKPWPFWIMQQCLLINCLTFMSWLPWFTCYIEYLYSKISRQIVVKKYDKNDWIWLMFASKVWQWHHPL